MKLNKKGMTLIELVISIALISIVLAFLFKLILDVKHERDNPGFATASQLNRTEIISKVQNDFKNKSVNTYISGADFVEFNNNYMIKVDDTKKIISIKDKRWEIKDETYVFGNVEKNVFGIQNKCYLKINIPILEAGYENENFIDDIEFLLKLNNSDECN